MYVYSLLPNLFTVPGEPQSMRITAITSSSVTLQWRPPKTPNGVITQYSIQYNETAIADLGSNVMYTIEELSPDTVYVLQLRAHTVVGAGSPSSLTIVTGKLFMLLYIYYIHTCWDVVIAFINCTFC